MKSQRTAMTDNPVGAADQAAEVSSERIGGLDGDALDETGADVALGLIVAGVGTAAWSLTQAWIMTAMFVFGGIAIMASPDRRIRLVGPFIVGAALFPFMSGLAASFVATAIYGAVSGLYHHELVDLAEVI